jgi:nicotinate-nucleotide pyrophosphorylase (carboxylating)
MTADPFGPRTLLSLDPEMVRREVRRFLAEDVGGGDATTDRVVPAGAGARAWIVAREACVVAGIDVARTVFQELEAAIEYRALVEEGTAVPADTRLALVAGRAGPILTGERVALNLLQRLSGIATITRRYVDAIAGTDASVSDTRKTTPGLRAFEKYAVHVGGGRNHRMGLHDAVLIKDNHISVAGGVEAAFRATRGTGDASLPVQIEVDSLEQLARVLDLGVQAVLLDNMTSETVETAVRQIRAHPAGRSCWIEASGGITLQNIRAYAEAGVDTISVGALTHSAPSVDVALDFEPSDGSERR